MRYAQFYRRNHHGDLNVCCGSDGVYIFDGRFGILRCHADALTCLRKRGFHAYEIWQGESFAQSRPITPLIEPSLSEILQDDIPC